MNKILIAAVLLLSVPASVLAQKEKEKVKDKKDVQQIIVTRTGDKSEKTIIEIVGDKVKVNGKEVTDNTGDVKVRLNNLRGATVYAPAADAFAFNFDGFDRYPSIYRLDSNRAMLGIVTEGKNNGAEVMSITKATAAEKAGLKKGDIITRIDSKKIESSDDVTDAIRAKKPGEKVSITYLRDGKEQKATAELGRWRGIQMNTAVAMPRIADAFERVTPRIQGNGDFYTMALGRPRLGASVQDTEDGKGAKVLDVEDESNAEKAGLKEGDVITQIDDKAVNGADDVARLLREKRESSSVKLQVLRDGRQQTLDVKFPKRLKTVDL